MRLAVLTTSFPRFQKDEAAIFVKRMVEAFSELGLQGHVFVPYDKNEAIEETLGAFNIQRFKYGLWTKGRLAFGSGIVPNLRHNPLLLFQAPLLLAGFVYKALKTQKTWDIMQANWLVAGFAAWIVSLLSGKPYVITLRGEDMRLIEKVFFRFLFTPAIKRAKAICSVNASFLETLKRLYNISDAKLFCIPNGVDVPEVSEKDAQDFAEQNDLLNLNPFLLFIGTTIPRKKLEVLINLIAKPEMSEFSLVLCGRTTNPDYLRSLEELAQSKNCSKRVVFKGPVAPQEIPSYLKLASFYISASEFEGRPNSILEACAANLPIFASDIDAHREIIKNKESGFLFNPDDLDKLAMQINEVHKDQDRYQQVSKTAKNFVRQFSWAHNAKQYLELFNS